MKYKWLAGKGTQGTAGEPGYTTVISDLGERGSF